VVENIPLLNGIAHLLAVLQPDTRLPDKDVAEFAAIRRFGDVLPIPPTC